MAGYSVKLVVKDSELTFGYYCYFVGSDDWYCLLFIGRGCSKRAIQKRRLKRRSFFEAVEFWSLMVFQPK